MGGGCRVCGGVRHGGYRGVWRGEVGDVGCVEGRGVGDVGVYGGVSMRCGGCRVCGVVRCGDVGG